MFTDGYATIGRLNNKGSETMIGVFSYDSLLLKNVLMLVVAFVFMRLVVDPLRLRQSCNQALSIKDWFAGLTPIAGSALVLAVLEPALHLMKRLDAAGNEIFVAKLVIGLLLTSVSLSLLTGLCAVANRWSWLRPGVEPIKTSNRAYRRWQSKALIPSVGAVACSSPLMISPGHVELGLLLLVFGVFNCFVIESMQVMTGQHVSLECAK